MDTRSRHWNASTINHMLGNRVYVGDQVWFQSKKEGRDGRKRTDEDQWIVTEDAHPALIEREVFKQRQELAASRQFMVKSQRKHVSYLLSRVMVCGCCGSNFHGRRHKYTSKKTGKTNEKFRYYCGAYLSKGPSVCKPLGIPRDWADELVMSTIRARLSSGGAMGDLQERVRQRIDARRQVYGEDSRRVEQKLVDLERRIANYYKAIGDGMDVAVCQQHITELSAKKEQLEAEAAILRKQDYYDRAREKNLAQLERFGELMERRGQDMPFEVKRQVVLHFIKKVEVLDRERLEVTLRIPLDNEGIKLLTDELEATFQADVEVAPDSFRSGGSRGATSA